MKLLLSFPFALGFIVLTHVSGLIGLQTQYAEWFLALTPINLLVSFALLLLHHPQWKRSVYIFLGVCFAVGFGVEVIGVQTGWPFGAYSYGEPLGFQLFGVPLVIGINWVMLVYIANMLVQPLKQPWWLKAFWAAFVLVLMDFLIEPVAIHLQFWTWESTTVPWTNYLAWFVVAYGLSILFQQLRFAKENRLAGPLLFVQVLFFGILSLLI